MAKRMRTRTQMKQVYHGLLAAGYRRLDPETEVAPDPMAALVEEFRARREAGKTVSIRRFCGEHRVSQKQFEARLREGPQAAEGPAEDAVEYYRRPEVQEALHLWAQGRRLAAHYANGVVALGFRRPEDVAALAAAASTRVPTFHASVGRYSGSQLRAFELVAEVDYKGNWRECFRVTRPLLDALRDAGIPFLAKFSGHSSAHVLVPCRGGDFTHTAVEFLNRLPASLRRNPRLDLSFRSPQHFLRMPYALHEKTGLASLPLTVEEFDAFDPEMARPENVVVRLDRLEAALSADNTAWLLG